MTAYRIFRKHLAPASMPNTVSSVRVLGGWEDIGTQDAGTAKQAIALVAEKLGTDANGVTFAATPDGNWTELTTAVETRTAVSFS